MPDDGKARFRVEASHNKNDVTPAFTHWCGNLNEATIQAAVAEERKYPCIWIAEWGKRGNNQTGTWMYFWWTEACLPEQKHERRGRGFANWRGQLLDYQPMSRDSSIVD